MIILMSFQISCETEVFISQGSFQNGKMGKTGLEFIMYIKKEEGKNKKQTKDEKFHKNVS